MELNKAPARLERTREEERTNRSLPQIKDNSNVTAVNRVIILSMDSTLKLTLNQGLPHFFK